jgi:hypothetical protein
MGAIQDTSYVLRPSTNLLTASHSPIRADCRERETRHETTRLRYLTHSKCSRNSLIAPHSSPMGLSGCRSGNSSTGWERQPVATPTQSSRFSPQLSRPPQFPELCRGRPVNGRLVWTGWVVRRPSMANAGRQRGDRRDSVGFSPRWRRIQRGERQRRDQTLAGDYPGTTS